MNEAIKLTADWLVDPTDGFAATLTVLPRITGHAAVTPMAAIYNRNDHAWVARGKVPRDGRTALFPHLAVTFGDAASLDPSVKTASSTANAADGTVPVAIQWNASDPESATAAVECGYVLRALRGTLLLMERAPIARRTLNGIQLVQLLKLHSLHGPISTEDSVLSGCVVALWKTRETVPQP